jgi:hypothetical protein
MQDNQITPSDDAQRRLQLSALYQDQLLDGASPQALPSASSDTCYPDLEKLYIFRDASEVTSFLEENPFLIPLLVESYPYIKKYFPDADVFLEVVHDPEIIGYTQLIAFIAVRQNAEEADEALDRLDEEWAPEALERAGNKFLITLEFGK